MFRLILLKARATNCLWYW